MVDRVNPVLVEVTRGALVESRHRGAIAVVDSKGRLIGQWGDIGRPVYARSAIKSLQAIALLESGAARHFRLGDREIALACASHSGEARHTKAVGQWLGRLGLHERDLECGAQMPLHGPTAEKMIRGRAKPSSIHNNCSGKHAGFLATAVHLGEAHRHYIDFDHPVQQRVYRMLEEMSDTLLTRAPRGIDGCGIPVIGMSLRGMARAMARMAEPKGLGQVRSRAIERIRKAIATQPFYVAGSGRFCTRVIGAFGGKVLLKTGAEGVFTGVVPAMGLGIALKIDDGTTRAAEMAMMGLLHGLKLIDAKTAKALSGYYPVQLANRAGRRVGEIRPALALTP